MKNMKLFDWLSDVDNQAALCILSTFLKYIWEARIAKNVVMKYKMMAEIEAKLAILRKRRHNAAAIKIEEMIEMWL